MTLPVGAGEILNFWFDELKPADWWKKSTKLDNEIRTRFLASYEAAIRGELYRWRQTPRGRLAEIIAIDQFARNIFRDTPEAFAHDGTAVVLSQEAIATGADSELQTAEKSFLYMPLMHSESLVVHELAMKVFDQPGLEHNFEFEKKHLAIIERFGRYPHRNAILGRESTPEEEQFLSQPGSSF